MIQAKSSNSRARHQRGSSLVEALIGTLLMGIILAGLSMVLSRTLVSQRYLNAQSTFLLEMRETLQNQGLEDICANGAGTLLVGGTSVVFDASSCQSPAVTISLAGVSSHLAADTVPAISVNLSTTSNAATQSLFGGNGVMKFSY